MKAIMISIKPKWVAKILNGEKTIEVRRNKAISKAIQKLIDKYGHAEIYVYCTKDKDLCVLADSPFREKQEYFLSDTDTALNGTKLHVLNGKVIFKFRCYKVEETTIVADDYFTNSYIWVEDLLKDSCLVYEELDNYLKRKKGYAIHISDLQIFDKPKELSEFEKVGSYNNPTIKCPKKEQGRCNYGKSPFTGKRVGCVKARLTKAPQNMVYIEV